MDLRSFQSELNQYDLEYATVLKFGVQDGLAILTLNCALAGGMTFKEVFFLFCWPITLFQAIFKTVFRQKTSQKEIETFDITLSLMGVQPLQEPTIQQAIAAGILDEVTGELALEGYEELNWFDLSASEAGNLAQIEIECRKFEFHFTDCSVCRMS